MTTTTIQAPAGYTFVCAQNTLPTRGKKSFQIGSTRLLLVACDQHLYAVEDRCPQTARSITTSEILNCVLKTPVGARYSLQTGQYLSGGTLPVLLQSHWLTLFPVKVIEDRVYVRLPHAE
jgi:nitrite reductase/ring-hydroxylating ferredoxin subunit